MSITILLKKKKNFFKVLVTIGRFDEENMLISVQIRESDRVKGERNSKSIGASIKLRMHAVCRF